jgi:hypothetical protein
MLGGALYEGNSELFSRGTQNFFQGRWVSFRSHSRDTISAKLQLTQP